MKKTFLFFVSLLVGGCLLGLVIQFIGWQEIKSAFQIFSGWQALVILFLTSLILFTGLLKWGIILKSQDVNLSHRNLIAPYLAGFSITYFFPMILFGGEIFRGYILKEKFAVLWKKTISSVIIDRILEITVFLITIFIGLVIFLLKIGLLPVNLLIILGVGLFVFTIGISLFYFKVIKKESMAGFFIGMFNKNKLLSQEALDTEKEIFKFFKYNNKALWLAVGCAFLRVAVTWLRCWLLILFLGKALNPFFAFSVLGFYYFALLIPIPAALGSHELVQTFSFSVLGLGPAMASAFAMIQRGAELVLAITGVIISFKLGIGIFYSILSRKIGNLVNNRNNQN